MIKLVTIGSTSTESVSLCERNSIDSVDITRRVSSIFGLLNTMALEDKSFLVWHFLLSHLVKVLDCNSSFDAANRITSPVGKNRKTSKLIIQSWIVLRHFLRKSSCEIEDMNVVARLKHAYLTKSLV